VPADAGAEGTETARAGFVSLQIVQHRAIVRIVACHRLFGLQAIAHIRSCLIVGQHGSGGKIFMVDLRQRDDKAMSCQKGRRAADGSRELKNLRVKQQPRETTRRRRPQHHRAHRAGWRGEFNDFWFAESHEKMAGGNVEPHAIARLHPSPSHLFSITCPLSWLDRFEKNLSPAPAKRRDTGGRKNAG
jgi:hypothetical protein